MTEERIVPIRRGRAVNITLDWDAVEILDALAPSRHTMGRFVSQLLRNEQARRLERARLKEGVLKLFEESVCP